MKSSDANRVDGLHSLQHISTKSPYEEQLIVVCADVEAPPEQVKIERELYGRHFSVTPNVGSSS